jgi:glucose/arabinose dehydrogenase
MSIPYRNIKYSVLQLDGRANMQVRNEINVLKRVSQGHRNIVSLVDFFETTHNLYVSLASDR